MGEEAKEVDRYVVAQKKAETEWISFFVDKVDAPNFWGDFGRDWTGGDGN